MDLDDEPAVLMPCRECMRNALNSKRDHDAMPFETECEFSLMNSVQCDACRKVGGRDTGCGTVSYFFRVGAFGAVLLMFGIGHWRDDRRYAGSQGDPA